MTVTSMDEMNNEYRYGYTKAKLDAIKAVITSPLLTFDSERINVITAILEYTDDSEDFEIE